MKDFSVCTSQPSKKFLHSSLSAVWVKKVTPGSGQLVVILEEVSVSLSLSVHRLGAGIVIQPEHSKSYKNMCILQKVKSACASAQFDQRIHCLHEAAQGPWLLIE